ncbi:hypothetical protein PR202_gb08908 [Eleusine coracana subsp. coracana]|uniref:NAD-dependent epimerase/dehydratase domain-containing protein n=1 Tax=Eleusine coracana subsp. coracana TaxID=191504 RepID=A0AAV5EGZ2_ELECO|nr:hypothetical protein PR202_gb08908 [Eleusine coracana subsp. coracana]
MVGRSGSCSTSGSRSPFGAGGSCRSCASAEPFCEAVRPHTTADVDRVFCNFVQHLQSPTQFLFYSKFGTVVRTVLTVDGTKVCESELIKYAAMTVVFCSEHDGIPSIRRIQLRLSALASVTGRANPGGGRWRRRHSRVCVTGGGGFIASWLVKLLLSRGYAVHATLRDPSTYRSFLDWYSVAKITAEQIALDYADKNGLNVVTLCPPLAFGPLLQPTVNTSSNFLIDIVKGGPDAVSNRRWPIVDVRDVADASLLLYETKDSSGRYICSPNHVSAKDLVDLLKKMYPEYSYADKLVDIDPKEPLSSQKLMDLGWVPRKLEETLADSIECYEKAGLLQDVAGRPFRLPHLYRLAGDQ